MPSSPKVPEVPDYQAVSAQQKEANKWAGTASQAGSMVDQFNPFGSVQYEQSGVDPTTGVPTYKSNVQFSPEQQQLLDYLVGTQTTAGAAANPLLASGNYGQAPDLSTGTDSRVSQRLGQQVSYLDPYFQQGQENLDNQLRNQGLEPGSQAYDRALKTLRDTQGGQVQKFLSEIQPEAFQQTLQEYALPLATSMQLAQFGAPTNPLDALVTAPGANYQPANVIGAANSATQNQLGAYDRKKAQYDSMISGLYGIGGSILGTPFGPAGSTLGSNMLQGIFG